MFFDDMIKLILHAPLSNANFALHGVADIVNLLLFTTFLYFSMYLFIKFILYERLLDIKILFGGYHLICFQMYYLLLRWQMLLVILLVFFGGG